MIENCSKARKGPFFVPHLVAGLLLVAFLAPAAAQESQDDPVATENESEIAPDSDGDVNGELSFTNLDQAVDERLSLQGTGVVLQGLDKITARVSTFSVPLDELAVFGSLQIMVRACFKTPPEDAPENATFLEIIEQKPDSEARKVFGGWMFSSSPAVSALEHPVYDVWVHNCILPGDTDFEYSSGDEVGEPGGEGDQPEGDAGG